MDFIIMVAGSLTGNLRNFLRSLRMAKVLFSSAGKSIKAAVRFYFKVPFPRTNHHSDSVLVESRKNNSFCDRPQKTNCVVLA